MFWGSDVFFYCVRYFKAIMKLGVFGCMKRLYFSWGWINLWNGLPGQSLLGPVWIWTGDPTKVERECETSQHGVCLLRHEVCFQWVRESLPVRVSVWLSRRSTTVGRRDVDSYSTGWWRTIRPGDRWVPEWSSFYFQISSPHYPFSRPFDVVIVLVWIR